MLKQLNSLLLNKPYPGILQGYDQTLAGNSTSKTANKPFAFLPFLIESQESYCKPSNNSDHGKL